MPHNVKISVIIPNLHSPIVDQTIESVLAQEADLPFEVIVVGMDKWGLVEKYPEVQFIRTDEPIPPGAARNLGVSSSKGNLLLFIDSDCIASPDWINKHIFLHQKTENLIILGGGVTFPSTNYFTLADNVSSFHEFMVHNKAAEKIFLPSINLSLSKSVWNIVGGFNHNPAGEDTDFSLRAISKNFKLFFAPDLYVEHLPNRRKLSDLFQHTFVFGYYSIKANRAYSYYLNVPFPLRNSFLSIILSPFLAFGVVLKMLIIEKLPIRYWHTLPLVFLIKIVWCFGYSKQLRKKDASISEKN
jgi:glycosyltransferase involved in cell wall biosynthesis